MALSFGSTPSAATESYLAFSLAVWALYMYWAVMAAVAKYPVHVKGAASAHAHSCSLPKTKIRLVHGDAECIGR